MKRTAFLKTIAGAMSGSAMSGRSLPGAENHESSKPRGITFSNLDVTFPGGGTAQEAARRQVPDLERDYPECFIFGILPAYGLYAHHAQGLTLNNVRFRLEAEDLRPAIVCDDVQGLELAGFNADGHPKAESLLRFQETEAAWLTGIRVLDPLGTFLRVEGERSRRIILKGNDLALADRAVSASPNVPAGAVSKEPEAGASRRD